MNDYVLLGLTGLHVLAAARVTGHALMTKADGRAAVAWIGLAWLSPLVGSALYAVFGINRIARKATRLSHLYRSDRPEPETGAGPEPDVPANLVRAARVGRRITGRRLTKGNAATLYEKGDAAAAAMLDAIDQAQRSVAVASYIFEVDQTGEAFVDALVRAHGRGVAVRVLVDGVGGGYFSYPILRRLRGHGVPASSFLHSWQPWRMPFLNMRNHKKLLVLDGQRAFTGGMNIADHTMRSPVTVRDTHAEFAGPLARHLMQAFADDWSFTTGESLTDDCWWPNIPAAEGVTARALTSGPDEDIETLEIILATAIVEARERIRIVTPYFLPDRHLQMALSLAVLRGVTVEVVIPEHSNKPLVDWATRANIKFLADITPSVFLSRPPFDHSKLMTVDGAFCIVGSSNWDVRSHRLNFELDVEIYDSGLTDRLDRAIDRKIDGSRALQESDIAARPGWMQLRDATARLLLPYL